MYWNRYDIVEAWYLALSHCIAGQDSPEYARLCRLRNYFKPSPFLCVERLNENARAIYEAACDTMCERYREE